MKRTVMWKVYAGEVLLGVALDYLQGSRMFARYCHEQKHEHRRTISPFSFRMEPTKPAVHPGWYQEDAEPCTPS